MYRYIRKSEIWLCKSHEKAPTCLSRTQSQGLPAWHWVTVNCLSTTMYTPPYPLIPAVITIQQWFLSTAIQTHVLAWATMQYNRGITWGREDNLKQPSGPWGRCRPTTRHAASQCRVMKKTFDWRILTSSVSYRLVQSTLRRQRTR